MTTALRLEVRLSMIERVTAPLKRLQLESRGTARDISRITDRLKDVSRQTAAVETFRKLKAESVAMAQKMQAAQDRVAALSRGLSAAGPPTKAMARDLAQARAAASRMSEQQENLMQRLNQQREALNNAGISTRGLGQHQRTLTRDTADLNAALTRERMNIERINEQMRRGYAAKAQFQQGMRARNQLAGTGVGMTAAGVAVGAAFMAPVKAYAEAEDAATQLRVAMMRANGQVSEEFAAINALANRLGTRLPGTTAEFQNMMTMLIRQGIPAKNVLEGVGEAAGYLAVQMKMPFDEAASFAAKMQDATRTSNKDMLGLMDQIQRTFYLGVDPNNMLEGFAKISPALDVLRKSGVQAVSDLAPLLVMFDQAGMRGEASGNALRKVLTLGMDKDKRGKMNAIISASGSAQKIDLSDGKGEFGGLDKMFAELAKLRGLTKEAQIMALKKGFGDDAETHQVLSILIDKGKAGYEEVLAKMKAQADLRMRVEQQLGTLANLWDAASGTFKSLLARVGESIGPELKAITKWLTDVSDGLTTWATANPGVANAIMKTIGFVALFTAGLGGLLLALAAVLGPFVFIRYGLTMLGMNFGMVNTVLLAFRGMAIWAFGALRTGAMIAMGALRALSILIIANPIVAVLTAIAMAALYIWANWGTLGPKFAALWQYIKTTAIGAWDGITGYVSGLAAQFYAFGANIISGLINGIKSQAVALKDTVVGAASSAAGWFKQKLGIRSPSRVFLGYGQYIMQGLGLGITDAANDPIARLDRVMTQAKKTALGALAGAAISLPAAAMPSTATPPIMGSLPALQQVVNLIPTGMLDRLPPMLQSVVRTAQVMLPDMLREPIKQDSRPPLRTAAAEQRERDKARDAISVQGQGGNTYTVTINAAPGMDARALAQEVRRQLDDRDAAHAARRRGRLVDHD